MSNQITYRAAFAVSETGVLAIRTGTQGVAVANDLGWFSRAGKALGTVGDTGPYIQVRLSPDEKRVVVGQSNPGHLFSGLSTLDLNTNIMSPLTVGAATDPVWSPDSTTVMFEIQKGKFDFYQQVVGTRTMTMVFESPDTRKVVDDWSRDGQFVLFHLNKPSKLYALPLSGGQPRLLAETTETFDEAHFSPDGKWVAYESDESAGVYEVWVAAFPAFDNRRRVSAHGGGEPFWRGDGRELFYLTPDGQMMSVAITPDPAKPGAIEFHAPQLLFASPIPRPVLVLDQYSVTRDGQRFLFLQAHSDTSRKPDPITVVVNWQTGMKK